jgi:hypothetical protein
MYLITKTTKDQISDCLYQSNLILASIPESICDDKMKEVIASALFQAQLKMVKLLIHHYMVVQELSSVEQMLQQVVYMVKHNMATLHLHLLVHLSLLLLLLMHLMLT